MLYCQFTAWAKNPLICKSNMATAKNILATLYSESYMTADNFNSKFLVLWSVAMTEGRNKQILAQESFSFGGLTILKK